MLTGLVWFIKSIGQPLQSIQSTIDRFSFTLSYKCFSLPTPPSTNPLWQMLDQFQDCPHFFHINTLLLPSKYFNSNLKFASINSNPFASLLALSVMSFTKFQQKNASLGINVGSCKIFTKWWSAKMWATFARFWKCCWSNAL